MELLRYYVRSGECLVANEMGGAFKSAGVIRLMFTLSAFDVCVQWFLQRRLPFTACHELCPGLSRKHVS